MTRRLTVDLAAAQCEEDAAYGDRVALLREWKLRHVRAAVWWCASWRTHEENMANRTKKLNQDDRRDIAAALAPQFERLHPEWTPQQVNDAAYRAADKQLKERRKASHG